MIFSRTIAIGGSLLLRSVFMLLLATTVYRVLPNAETAIFLQILFFQGIVIAFLSASGFFRAQALETDQDAICYLAAMLLLVIPSLVLPVALFLFGEGYGDYGIEIGIMWLGAVATSFGAPLTGYVMQHQGPYRAFFPSAIAAISAIFVLLVLVDEDWAPWVPYGLLASFQVAAFGLLVCQRPHLIKGAFATLLRDGIGLTYHRIGESVAVGAANISNLLVIFALRHHWELRADVEIVAAVFLVLRFSDAGIQLLHMVMSGHALVTKIFRSSAMSGILLLSAVVVACGAGAVFSWGFSPLLFAIMCQVIVDTLRYPASLAFVQQMKAFNLRNYVWFTLLPPAVTAIVAGVLVFTGHPLAVYAIIITMALTGAFMTLRFAGTKL